MTNVLSALAAAGLRPCAIHVAADGSFRVEIAGEVAPLEKNDPAPKKQPDALLNWEDVV